MTPEQMDATIMNILAIAKGGVESLNALELLLAAQEGKWVDTFDVRDSCWRLITKDMADYAPMCFLKAKGNPDRREAIKALDRFIMRFLYVDWQGVRSFHRVLPLRMKFAATKWHPDPQWLMDAIDVDKGEERSFAMKDMRHEG